MCFPILIKAFSNQLTNSEIKCLLKENNISKDEFNSKILSLISNDNEFVIKDNLDNRNLVDRNLVEKILVDRNLLRHKAILSDNNIIRDILEEYSKIEYCPSFLQHQAILHEEDFKFSTQIYSKIFKLKNSPKKECWEKLTEMFDKYLAEK
jgi:hypothetical protein